MADLSIFYPDIEARAPGCPVPRMLRAVRWAARVFCHETEAWRHSFTTTMVKGTNDVDMDLPNQTSVVTVHEVRVNDDALRATNRKQLAYDLPDWDQSPGRPEKYFLEGEVIKIAPLPDQTVIHQIHVDVSLRPKLMATTIDDDFLEQWYEMILNGSLAQLLQQKDTGWTDRGQSEMLYSLFYSSIEDVTARQRNDHVYRGLVTSYGGL